MSLNPITNFKDSNGVDLGSKLVTKEYFLNYYPSIVQNLRIPSEILSFGDNDVGELGTNDTTFRYTPTPVLNGGVEWVRVGAGESFSAGIKKDGTLWVWGDNSSANLGVNDGNNRSTPVTTFAGGNNWKEVVCSADSMSAIKTDGSLWLWGSSINGRLGNNDNTIRSTPITTFAGGFNWKQVSSYGGNVAAVKDDGTLWVWGNNANGRLGINDGSTNARSTPVTTFAGGNNWKQASSNTGSMAAVKLDGTLWVWGNNGYAQLGVGDTNSRSTPVTTFAGGTNWNDIRLSGGHAAAIKTDGTLWVWGFGQAGRLGTNDEVNRLTPVTTFTGGNNWKYISGGFYHTSAIKTDGTLWLLGGSSVALGINQITSFISTPVTTFAGGANWKQSSTGFYHTIAIRSVDF